MATTREALGLLKKLPKVTLGNIKGRLPPKAKKPLKRQRGLGDRGQGKYKTLPRIGFEGGQTPFYIRTPKEPYYNEHHLRKEYVPLSLLQLQRMIDLGRLDVSRPIDLAALCRTKLLEVDVIRGQYGVHITDEGADIFQAEICLEVQWADELAIASLERAGSRITNRYYDPRSLGILTDPIRFFKGGRPIPACKTPTTDVLEYYSSASKRGYLASEEDIQTERYTLSQRYGYILPEISERVVQLSNYRKHHLQTLHGLQPGWIVNLTDKQILKPRGDKLVDFYKQEFML